MEEVEFVKVYFKNIKVNTIDLRPGVRDSSTRLKTFEPRQPVVTYTHVWVWEWVC